MRTLTISDQGLLGQQRLTYAQLVLQSSPLGYWPLGAGTTDTDLSGNGRDLAWSGTTPTSTQLLPNTAGGITVAGASLSRHPSATTLAAWNSTQTIEAWVKFTSTSDIAIVSLRNTNEHFALYHDNTNKLRFAFAYNSGLLVAAVNTAIALNDGNLHHVVVTWSGTTYDVFIDGAANVTGGALAQTYSQSASNTYLTVGSEVGPTRRWIGQLGHVALYPTRLTLAVAQAHNTRGRA